MYLKAAAKRSSMNLKNTKSNYGQVQKSSSLFSGLVVDKSKSAMPSTSFVGFGNSGNHAPDLDMEMVIDNNESS